MDGTPEPVREHARARLDEKLPYVTEHLRRHDTLVGNRFTVADAYLT